MNATWREELLGLGIFSFLLLLLWAAVRWAEDIDGLW